MRAVIQRVRQASVKVADRETGSIGRGLLVLLGVKEGDSEKDMAYLAEKTMHLRIFEDEKEVMNRSVLDLGAEVLVVSQFTLYGDCRKGRRPSYSKAATPQTANHFYQCFVEAIRQTGLRVATGEFQAMMQVELINDGPVTILLDSEKTI
ncbi:MAG: D-aminoacyl-tRNA deacylase [Deltaproteobacteria bacterium]